MKMALMYLLDTSVYSQPLKPTLNTNVVSRWRALGDAPLAISVIVEAEVRYGLALKGSARLYAAYEALLNVRHFALIADIEVEDWSLP
jgi:predicted nucleic acid-binding protein